MVRGLLPMHLFFFFLSLSICFSLPLSRSTSLSLCCLSGHLTNHRSPVSLHPFLSLGTCSCPPLPIPAQHVWGDRFKMTNEWHCQGSTIGAGRGKGGGCCWNHFPSLGLSPWWIMVRVGAPPSSSEGLLLRERQLIKLPLSGEVAKWSVTNLHLPSAAPTHGGRGKIRNSAAAAPHC